MKKLFTLLLGLGILSFSANSQCGNLYIGGVIDGGISGGLPKGVQFCASGAIEDLSIYGFGSANNGGGTDGEEYTFDVLTVNAGECFWVASEATQFTNFFGFAPCFTNSAANINGDDAIELFCSGALTDVFGDPNTNGDDECWDYTDGWGVNNSGAPSTTFDCANWTFSGVDELDGEMTNAGAANPYPSPEQTCPLEALPIELAHFEASLKNDNVDLNWATYSEVNNDYFEVQHSNDGINYKTIGMVEGAGNSTSNEEYSFIHDAPRKGLNYYRLNQVDYSKASTFSQVASVEFRGAGALAINPTLVNNFAVINISKESGEKEILIHNLSGAIVSRISTRDNGSFEIDLSSLAAGTYIVSLRSASDVQSAKIVKQ